MKRLAALLWLCTGWVGGLQAQDWFPFEMPWDDDSKTAVDASALLVDFPGQDPAAVIDSRGFVRARSDGHFYFEKTGKRARFWGVNFTFNACFPHSPDMPPVGSDPGDPQSAEKVARRLAKLGVNVVRFHHMDFFASRNGIFDPKYFPNDTQHLDEGQLRRFDWLVYQLRKNGIYTNINLKVARHFGPGDGLPDTDKFGDSLSFFQGVSHFNARMIELQRDYARQLLTHRNPYTDKTYAQDPAVFCVEIANEDSMFGNLLNDGGLNYLPEVRYCLPEKYSRDLDQLWNQWLRRRYSGQAELEVAWAYAGPPVDSSDRVHNGDFEDGMSGWGAWPIGSAAVTYGVVKGTGPDGGAALQLQVVTDGVNWHVQAAQSGHAVEKDKTYEVRFYARSATPATISVSVMKGADPWLNYGMSQSVNLTSDWRSYAGRFRANTTDGLQARITFDVGATTTTIWLDKVEFREVGLKGLAPDETLANDSVRRPVRSELGSFTAARVLDLFRFYAEIDEAYFGGMRRYLKEELGVQALVTGTAPWWAFLGDTAVQSELDFVDGHYYWDHPYWVGVPAWSSTGWRINNRPLINELQDLGGLASQVVQGKPFTVSEFNEPFPNRYALEGPLLIALLANLQDWDAVYMFAYAGSTVNFAYNYVHSGGYFDLAGNQIKTAQLPTAARIFLGRQSEPAPDQVEVELGRDELALGYAKGQVNGAIFLEAKGLDRRAFLRNRLRIRSFERADPVSIDVQLPAGSVTSSHGELVWDRGNPEACYLRVDGMGVQGGIGFLRERRLDFRDWSFTPEGGPDHLAVLLQARDAPSLREARRMILSVWTEHQNTNMVWNTDNTSLENQWGEAPPLVRSTRIAVTMRLPAGQGVQIYPLDARGYRRNPLGGVAADGATAFVIDTARDQTVWYEVVTREAASAVSYSLGSGGLFQLYTDAAEASARLGWMKLAPTQGTAPLALPLMEYVSRGVLSSLVRLPAAEARNSWRIPVVRGASVETAAAVLNPGQGPLDVFMRLWDKSGVPLGDPHVESLSGGQTKAFYAPERFSLATDFEGSLELAAGGGFVAMALRSAKNPSGDECLTPQPAAPQESGGPLYLAQLAADESYSSELLFLNTRSRAVRVKVELFTPSGEAAAMLDGQAQLDFALQPAALSRLILERPPQPYFGYARVSAADGEALPSVAGVIRVWKAGAVVSEIGAPAAPALKTHTLIAPERPWRHTALAIVNTGLAAATVELILTDLDRPGWAPRATAILAPGERRSRFLFEWFQGLPSHFNALLRVESAQPLGTLCLLGSYNSRGDFLLTALTEGDHLPESRTSAVPRYLSGAGHRTLLFLYRPDADATTAAGEVRFLDTQGQPIQELFR